MGKKGKRRRTCEGGGTAFKQMTLKQPTSSPKVATTLHQLQQHCISCDNTASVATTLHQLRPHCISCDNTASVATTLHQLQQHCISCDNTASVATTFLEPFVAGSTLMHAHKIFSIFYAFIYNKCHSS